MQMCPPADKVRASPFIKWAGGKKLLLPKILPHVPESYEVYHEPFMGGAALFFSLAPSRAYLADMNLKLIRTFRAVRDDVEAVISLLDLHEISREKYYEVRSSIPQSDVEEAVKFIYLNKTCWNGLYRENRKGEFNVPFGLRDKQKSPVVTEPDKLRRASEALQSCFIEHKSFTESLALPDSGDFVYLDPPYTVSHNNNGFIEYNSSIFSWEDQEKLCQMAHNLRDKGCRVLISNADHEAIRDLYSDFEIIVIERSSTIASKKDKRKRVTELIIKSY